MALVQPCAAQVMIELMKDCLNVVLIYIQMRYYTLIQGTSPLDNFQVKSEVKVRVIGFREPKSWK